VHLHAGHGQPLAEAHLRPAARLIGARQFGLRTAEPTVRQMASAPLQRRESGEKGSL